MTVNEFVSMEKFGGYFALVDADKQGYMSKPFIITEADRNVVSKFYGELTVIGYAPKSKNSMFIYVTHV